MKKIDINTAAAADLVQLPGIGEKLAEAIVRHREEHGPFRQASDLEEVEKLSAAVVERINPLLTFSLPKKERQAAEAPELYFCGIPGAVYGLVPVSGVAQKERIEIGFGSSRLRNVQEQPLETTVLKRKIFPGKARAMKVKIPISRNTPPGIYETTIHSQGREFPVKLEVVERPALALWPSELFVEGAPGETVEKTVVFTNQGNVPLRIDEPGELSLSSAGAGRGVFQRAIQRYEGNGLDGFLDALVKEMKGALDTDAVTVRLKGGTTELSAGATQPLVLRITLPKTMRLAGPGNGKLRFYNAQLRLTVQVRQQAIR